MTVDTFVAESRLDVVDNLSPAIAKAADLAMGLETRLGALAKLAAKLGLGEALAKSFPEAMIQGLGTAAAKAGEFSTSLTLITEASERFAQAGGQMMTPLMESLAKAQQQLAE